jgi:SSS family solute:Na+ symporter
MIDALIVAGFLGACLALGARARREEGLEGWILAGRALTLPLFVATLVPTFYGGVLGIGEFTWSAGLSNWTVMALPYYAFAALYAFFLAGKVRLTAGLTIPDHLASAYGRPMALLGALLVFILASPSDELLMAGTLLGHLTGLPAAAASAPAALLAQALIWRGGLRSDASANRLQFVAMFAGFALIIPFAWHAVGSPAEMVKKLPVGHMSLTGGLGPMKLAGWWLIAVWTIVDPSFHQRCAAAETPAVARRGILISIGFWAVFDLLTTTAGLYARAALPALGNPTLAFPLLADAVMPPVARGLFFAGVSASLFAALQGTAMIAAACLGKSRVRAGLIATMILSYALSRLVPSIVGLWYAVGSAVIPGLLLPMLGVYLPGLRVQGRWAVASSAAGWLVSLAWVCAAAIKGAAPLGVEPMFPGLLLSGAIWAAGYVASSTRTVTIAPMSTPHAPQ